MNLAFMKLHGGFNLLLITCSLVFSGCSTPTVDRQQRRAMAAAHANAAQNSLLYLLAWPHPRVYVEVDAVQGCEPKEDALKQLNDFLSKYCTKPGGVEVVRSDVIPIKDARQLPRGALARKYMNGPNETNSVSAAYLYVLYYDDTLSRYSSLTRWLHLGAHPYAETSPYPAIYFNRRFSLGMAQSEILLHEAGHILGLVDRSTRAGDPHCHNLGCQMNTSRHYLFEFRWLPFRRQSPLCAECVAEVRKRLDQPPPTSLHYVGPVLVRSEANYAVASLPDRAGVLVGSYTDSDAKEFAEAVRSEPGGGPAASTVYCRVKNEALTYPAKLKDTLDRVKKDPSELVRRAAPKALLQACAQGYGALAQYSNVVDILQQAIVADEKARWSYNALAWLKATCPSAAIRNGDEAVTAATKACELTAWKDWTCIDTLAAAWAEAGDFHRALEYQDQALRTGHPTDSELKEMRLRASLYKESRPFRENSDKP